MIQFLGLCCGPNQFGWGEGSHTAWSRRYDNLFGYGISRAAPAHPLGYTTQFARRKPWRGLRVWPGLVVFGAGFPSTLTFDEMLSSVSVRVAGGALVVGGARMLVSISRREGVNHEQTWAFRHATATVQGNSWAPQAFLSLRWPKNLRLHR
jgi:hypothetical protein